MADNALSPDTFRLFPAIDLRHGRVVRLREGRAEDETAYASDPTAMARSFEEAGASVLHLVDLDAAFGDGDHRAAIAAVAAALTIPVQVGGGVRADADVEALLEAGVWRVIIGSAAVERPEWVATLVERFGTERIVAGIDARDGEVRTRGWVEGSGQSATAVAADMVAAGVRTVIYTNIARDGMLTGPDLEATLSLAQESGARCIISGGVGDLDHIRAATAAARSNSEPTRLEGIIVGRALYENRFTLREALEVTGA